MFSDKVIIIAPLSPSSSLLFPLFINIPQSLSYLEEQKRTKQDTLNYSFLLQLLPYLFPFTRLNCLEEPPIHFSAHCNLASALLLRNQSCSLHNCHDLSVARAGGHCSPLFLSRQHLSPSPPAFLPVPAPGSTSLYIGGFKLHLKC